MSKIILAQQNTVLENLVNSEMKLRELNAQVETIVDDYGKSDNNADMSFFNVNNLYFWFLLMGLIFLAFGLTFLMVQLKNINLKKQNSKQTDSEKPTTEKESVQIKEEPKKLVKKLTPPKKRPVKVKVVKVK